MRFPPQVATRAQLAALCGIVVSTAFGLLVSPYLGAGLAVFSLLSLASRHGVKATTISFTPLQLRSQGAFGGVTIPWAFLSSVTGGGTTPRLTFVGTDEQVIRVPSGMMGLGALALHVDDFAPRSGFRIDEPARARLLEAYRCGLVEAQENPDAWLAQRSGPISRRA
jgi:hypothetical protein